MRDRYASCSADMSIDASPSSSSDPTTCSPNAASAATSPSCSVTSPAHGLERARRGRAAGALPECLFFGTRSGDRSHRGNHRQVHRRCGHGLLVPAVAAERGGAAQRRCRPALSAPSTGHRRLRRGDFGRPHGLLSTEPHRHRQRAEHTAASARTSAATTPSSANPSTWPHASKQPPGCIGPVLICGRTAAAIRAVRAARNRHGVPAGHRCAADHVRDRRAGLFRLSNRSSALPWAPTGAATGRPPPSHCLRISPEDGPTQTMLQRIEKLAAMPASRATGAASGGSGRMRF